MNKLKVFTVIGILFTLIMGTLSHFTYEWSGNNPIVGLVSAVNESVWEHMKLIFFPMLFYSFFMSYQVKNQYPCISSAFNAGILLGTLLIPTVYYIYTGILGYNLLILDIGTFVISVLISFYAVYRLSISCRFKKIQVPLQLIVLLFTISFMVFTYVHPDFT